MKTLVVIAISAITVGTLAWSRMGYQVPAMAQQTKGGERMTSESPFACDTMALTSEIRKRHFEVLSPMLVSMRSAVRELANGYEFEFPNNQKTFQLLTEWVFQ